MQNNNDDLKPLKLEQPYSTIVKPNKPTDPDKLGSWERLPHNSSKITRQKLDDALEVANAFKDIDTGNALSAPEGDSNDYFLKAKNNIVGSKNDRKIGEFLNQFHGMDFFKRGVPGMEKGLKGTGYDMGPSVSIKDILNEAVDKGDTEEVENIIEEHPEESQEALPEDTPIQVEAEQITEDTTPQNDEVNNEVVEDFVKENNQFKDIENKPYYDDWVNSEPSSEQFKNAYNSVVNDYGKEEADKQLEAWGIELPKEEDEFEAYAKQAGEEAGDRKRLENEQAKAFEEKLRHNNQQAWKDYALEKSKLNTRGAIRKGFEQEVGKSILAEIMTPEEWMNDSLREGVLRNTVFTRDPLTTRNNLRESIAKEKKALGIDEETLRAREEAEKKRRDEAWAKLMATDKKSTEKKSEKKSGGVDWDKVKVYEPGEDPYPKVSDESDWADKPDYEPSEGADVYLHHDEDFAGPDELPATIDQIRDEDFVGPDEQLAEYNGGLPAENQYEPVYDTSDYNFNWDAVIETLPPDLREDMESLPEEDKEGISKLLHINMGKANGINAPSSSGGNANPDIDIGTTRGGRGSIGRSMLGRSLGGLGISVSSGNVSGGKQPNSSMDTIRSVASKGPIPPKVNESNGSIARGGSNNSRPHSNGTFGSGPGMLFDKGVGDIKTVSAAPVVPVSSREDTVDENRISSPEDVKEAIIEGLESKIAQLSEEEMEALGIGHKYKHYDWKGIPLDELSGAQINELSGIVDRGLRN